MLSRSLTAFSPVRTSIADILRDAESLKSGLLFLFRCIVHEGPVSVLGELITPLLTTARG